MDQSFTGPTPSLAPLLEAFVATATEGTVTRAAEAIGVPQSTLSRRLRALEEHLGIALFLPEGRGLRLTARGQDFLSGVRGPLRALEGAVQAAAQDADAESGIVRFGFPLTLGPVSVPALLADFHRRAPGIRLALVQAHGEALTRMLADGELDLAIVIPEPRELPSRLLGFQPVRLLVSRAHPLADRERVDLAELAGERFVANPGSYHLRGLLERWCRAAGFEPEVAFEITEFETLRALVARGLGIALMPPAELPHPELVEIPLDGPDARRSIGLATGLAELTPAARRLHDDL
ncbi:LysR family transcriptional regulator, partial [Leucobacter sp. M11]|uniref:LysR family transcriptional regulator n=1 Tax=Leucobacter sp. M11 TaxID=2993565 RepID=UPI002D7EA03F